MNRKSLSTLLLTGILFVGCGRDPDGISRVTGPTVGRPGSASTLHIDLDELDYEVFSGTLYPGQDGFLSATSKTWGPNCVFSLVVPDSSMPAGSGPINFTMSIPKKTSHIANGLGPWMFIRLAPDQQFDGPITVTGTWMPWEGTPTGTPPDTLWVYDCGGTDSTMATITQVPGYSPPRYRVSYQVNHFSDWETGPGPKHGQ